VQGACSINHQHFATAIGFKGCFQEGVYTLYINLDPNADECDPDIFGKQYTIIDHIDRLPDLFIQLMK